MITKENVTKYFDPCDDIETLTNLIWLDQETQARTHMEPLTSLTTTHSTHVASPFIFLATNSPIYTHTIIISFVPPNL